jgi:hypothetical protein
MVSLSGPRSSGAPAAGVHLGWPGAARGTLPPAHLAAGKGNNMISGWWLKKPSEKYEFVSWDYDISNIWKNNPNVPNHQSVI